MIKIMKLSHYRQTAFLTKSVKLSNIIKYNSATSTELTIDQTCTSTSCASHTIILTQGSYKIELWGSQGGTAAYAASPGNGSYVSGNFTVTKETILYAFIGNRNGYNGGGSGGPGANSGANGGGATDIRLEGTGYENRIMVAGGGGGGGGHSDGGSSTRDSHKSKNGGNGDEDAVPTGNGYDGQPGKKGSQTNGGAGGAGGNYYSSTSTSLTLYPSGGGGGGGGYFGGGGGGSGVTYGGSISRAGNPGSSGTKGSGGSGATATYTYTVTGRCSHRGSGGGGGSSYVDTNKITMHEIFYGSSSFPNVVGLIQTGNQRNGAIRIKQTSEIIIEGGKRTCNYDIVFTYQKLFRISILISTMLKY
jgi:hypothetical protein